jgi:membrane-associated phospholipid phosphatase
MSFKPFHQGWAGLAEHARFSFPSAQALLAFTTATALAILIPRWRWAFYGGATLVALERLAENAHWLSDCVGAAGLGVVGVRLLWNPAAALAERAFNPQNVGQ